MEMKNKVIDYIQERGISVTNMSEILQIEEDKFDKNSEKNWEAQELLEICAFLKVDPMRFYRKRTKQGG